MRAGKLKKGMFVICQGNFARLLSVRNNLASIELLCYTAGTRDSYDRSVQGSVITVALDLFRAATNEEIAEYL